MKCSLIVEHNLQGRREKVVLPCKTKAKARRIVAENLTQDFQYCPLEKLDHDGKIVQDRKNPMLFRFTGTRLKFSTDNSNEYLRYQIV